MPALPLTLVVLFSHIGNFALESEVRCRAKPSPAQGQQNSDRGGL